MEASTKPNLSEMRILLLSDGLSYTSEQQFAPLLRYRRALYHRLGIIFDARCISDVVGLGRLSLANYHVIAVKLSWKSSALEVRRLLHRVRNMIQKSGKVIYFDGDDDLGVMWPEILPLVDCYVKKHCLKDRAQYGRRFVGKSNLTDYCSKTYGFDFTSTDVPFTTPIGPSETGKILLGWNVALDDPIFELFERYPKPPL